MVTDTDTATRGDESGHTLKLMTAASTPATPGPSSPTAARTIPLEQLKAMNDTEDIVPPTRPSSTPFPQQESLEGDIQCSRRLKTTESMAIEHHVEPDSNFASDPEVRGLSQPSSLCNLPVEIHECILDHLFGMRLSVSVASKTAASGRSKVLRGWGTALRHSRRREVSELALVSVKWRQLIQDRLYRHIKIKATRDSVEQALMWFQKNPHLCSYVKHIEFWFPVFQQKSLADRTFRIPSVTNPSTPTQTPAHAGEPGNTPSYQSPNNNCTLDEVFWFVRYAFPEARVLSLEGGERKKPPMVQQFRDPSSQSLPVLETIKTLVCKGQWNLIRSNDDFQNIAAALPNLVEWHSSYARGKSKSYLCMAVILPNLPQNLTNLNLCLENDFRREAVSPSFWRKVGLKTHFCVEMAKAMPALEHFAYTGRVCRSFFDTAASLSNVRTSRLRSVDLIVRNVCRPTFQWNDGSGITDMAFIEAFERLVISAVRSLDKLAVLESLRIKFIDLGECQISKRRKIKPNQHPDSVVPSLNPYFQLQDNKCTGIWSDQIVEDLARTRPGASFAEKSESLGDVPLFKDGQLLGPPTLSKTRPSSIKISTYASLSGGITIT